MGLHVWYHIVVSTTHITHSRPVVSVTPSQLGPRYSVLPCLWFLTVCSLPADTLHGFAACVYLLGRMPEYQHPAVEQQNHLDSVRRMARPVVLS